MEFKFNRTTPPTIEDLNDEEKSESAEKPRMDASDRRIDNDTFSQIREEVIFRIKTIFQFRKKTIFRNRPRLLAPRPNVVLALQHRRLEGWTRPVRG